MTDTAHTLGNLIRAVRRQRGWTLREMSQEVGIPLSTLAKVEQDRLSLTYDKLQQLSSRLGLTMAEFLAQDAEAQAQSPGSPPAAPLVMARRSLTGPQNSVVVETYNYRYEYLCADLREKRMVPIIGRIRAHSVDEFGTLIRHQGEEFIFVLEGTIEVVLQFYTPIVLATGQGIYLDSTMGHAYLAKDCDSALILAICSSEDPYLANTLINLSESEASV